MGLFTDITEMNLSSLNAIAVTGQVPHDIDEQPSLDFLDALVQSGLVVLVLRISTTPWAMIGPVSTPSSTKWTVHPVTLAPYASASRTPWAPGKLGSSAGWVLTHRPPNRARNSLPTIFMNPAETTRSGAYAAVASASAASHSSRESWSLTRQTKVGSPGPLGALQTGDAVAVGADGHDLGAVAVGSAAMASSRACRFVPDPETSTTRRAGVRAGRSGRGAGRPLAGALSRGPCGFWVCGSEMGLDVRTRRGPLEFRGTLRGRRPSATIPALPAAPTGRGSAWTVASAGRAALRAPRARA